MAYHNLVDINDHSSSKNMPKKWTKIAQLVFPTFLNLQASHNSPHLGSTGFAQGRTGQATFVKITVNPKDSLLKK